MRRTRSEITIIKPTTFTAVHYRENSFSHMILACTLRSQYEHKTMEQAIKCENRSVTIYHRTYCLIQKCKNTYLFKFDNLKLTPMELLPMPTAATLWTSNIYASSTHIKIYAVTVIKSQM